MKFNLIVNEQEREGFKLSVQADNEKELEIAKELTLALINKINKIDVIVTKEENY